jgi:FAD/FMN-containing dehydrogenase/Fe-S oxidoreductase
MHEYYNMRRLSLPEYEQKFYVIQVYYFLRIPLVENDKMKITSGILNVLNKSITGKLYTDRLTRYMLSTDGSIFRKEPLAVVYPENTQDVVKTAVFAQKNNLSLHARGGGSGLCGSALGNGIVIDFSRYMNKLLNIDWENKTFECEPGYRLGELGAELNGKGLFFPPDPSSGEFATFGGMFATNASGAHSVKYGNVSDYIVDARIVLSTGEVISLSDIYKKRYKDLPENLQSLFNLYTQHAEIINRSYPDIRCNVCGYNLRGLVTKNRLYMHKLFAGAEGTLGIVTGLKFRVLDKPAYNSLTVAFFDNIIDGASAVQNLLPMNPSGIEVMDKSLLCLARESNEDLKNKIPENTDNLLLIEFDSDNEDKCAAQAENAKAILKEKKLTNNIHSAVSDSEKAKFWAVRKAAVPILYKLKGEKKILALIEDASVPTDRITDYFQGIYKILNDNRVKFVVYGHIAKGLLHTRPLLNLKDKHDVELLKILGDQVSGLVHGLGGVVSGEHGDGRLRTKYIKSRYPEIYDLFLKTKELLDKKNILNPEIKTIHDPDQMKKNLRFGAKYFSTDIQNILNWPQGFVNEAEKCHGCSKCTTITTVTRMCPVYKFTRNESAAPKAKANLLRGLMSGAIQSKELYSKAFQNVMSLCIDCMSCSKECPSNVNIPKMAIEAKAQYVKQFKVSLGTRVLTNPEILARITHKFFGALEPAMKSGVVRRIGQKVTGLSEKRSLIGFSAKPLFDRIPLKQGKGDIQILYFAGCYATFIKPEIGHAAIRALTNIGIRVHTPVQHCCGVPMISKGMATQAENKIRQNLKKWKDLVSRVHHIVVTCPSCGLALKQKWADISGTDMSRISKKVIHITDIINNYSNRLSLEPLSVKAAYHNPCHLKIQPNPTCSVDLLSKIPEFQIFDLKSHCCGMAGTWGMYADNFDLSKKISSHLSGKLKQYTPDFAVTDCPACTIQIQESTDMKVLHPIEILSGCQGSGA